MDRSPHINLPIQLAKLDGLQLPFIYLNDSFVPQFISSRGAKSLDIRSRHELEPYQELLEPLISVSRELTSSKRFSIETNTDRHTVRELDLNTQNGRQVSMFVYAKKLDLHDTHGSQNSGFVVMFHDLSLLEPFFKTITQARRNRATILLISSFLGKNILFDASGKQALAVYQAFEKNFFKTFTSSNHDNLMRADLLGALSDAIDIIDPMIVSSSKILIDAKNSALLEVSHPNFLRIICHLILEASDFTGPFGTIRVQAELKKQINTRTQTARKYANITIIGHRKTQIPLDANPLELYLYSQIMPIHYKITVAPGSAPLGMTKFGKLSIRNANPAVSQEQHSDNLIIVSHIAVQCGIPLQIQRPRQNEILLNVKMPLPETTASG